MGFSKRQLYTDDEDFIYRMQRAIGINGINVVAQRPDLLDRGLLMGLEHVPDDKRRQMSEIQASLNRDHPTILGGFLDALVKALNEPEPKLPRGYRMADFVSWGYRIATGLGKSGEEFLQAYDASIQEAAEEAVRADILAEVLLEFMKENENHDWEGTATQLLSRFKSKAEELNISTRQKAWPKGSNALTRRLRLLKDPLRRIGCVVEFTRGQERLISISSGAKMKRKKEKSSSKPSKPSIEPRPSDDAGDIDDSSASPRKLVLSALRKITGPFSDDYAVGQITKTGMAPVEAKTWVNRLIDEGLLTKGPEGYLRMVK